MKLLVVVPLEDELKALVQALADAGRKPLDRQIGRIAGLAFMNGRLVVAEGGLGKAQFAVRTQHLIDHLDGVRLVVCAGTAGGLGDGLQVGDLVVATATVEHDFKRKFTVKPLPRFEGHAPTISALRSLAASINGGFQVHFGPVASGDEGIGDTERAKEVHAATGALAVAWEGAGCARACQFSSVPFLEIRGVTDSSDHKAMEDFTRNIPLAMRNVATVLERFWVECMASGNQGF
jgi:adenosylhomocysteine nucleosidase